MDFQAIHFEITMRMVGEVVQTRYELERMKGRSKEEARQVCELIAAHLLEALPEPAREKAMDTTRRIMGRFETEL